MFDEPIEFIRIDSYGPADADDARQFSLASPQICLMRSNPKFFCGFLDGQQHVRSSCKQKTTKIERTPQANKPAFTALKLAS
jgi:hypothetical protein